MSEPAGPNLENYSREASELFEKKHQKKTPFSVQSLF